MGKILSISEKLPTPRTLPDGQYIGTWGGYVIDLVYNERSYELKTQEGVRGINVAVVVTIKNGEATFETLNNR